MATPKKTTSSSSASSAKKTTSTTRKTGTTSSSRTAKKTTATGGVFGLPRYGWGAIWLVIGLLELFALFGGAESSISFIRSMFLSLIGAGWYVLAFCTLTFSALLLIRRKGPVRLQGSALMLFPMLWGALVHGIFSRYEPAESASIIGDLMSTGQAGESGGLFSGGLFELLNSATPALLVIFVLLILTIADIMCFLRVTPMALYRALARPSEYEYDDEEEREKYEKPRELPNIHQVAAEKRAHKEQVQMIKAEKKQSHAKPQIDISLENDNLSNSAQLPPAKRNPADFLREHLPQGMRGIDPTIVNDQVEGAVDADAVASTCAPNASTMPNPFEDTQPEQVDPFADILQMINHKQDKPIPTDGYAPAEDTQTVDEIASSVDSHTQTLDANVPIHIAPPAVLADDDDAPWDTPVPIGKSSATPTESEIIAAEIAAGQQNPAPVYLFPPSDLLNRPRAQSQAGLQAELTEYSHRLVDTLQSFGVAAEIIGIVRGPSVTRFEMTINRGIKFSRVTSLSDDIALSMGATSVRIAPIPDKQAIGIEVPNKTVTMVTIREVLESKEFRRAKSLVSFSVGKDITGAPIIGDIGKMPHLLIAGTTGSGKSVCINSLLISILYKATPAEVRLIMVDPKMVELGNYNGVPHLLIPVVTDPQKAAGALNWAVGEMERRYKQFADTQVRNLVGYNEVMERRRAQAMQTEGANPEAYQKLPEIVIVIDELADLMMVAAKDVETSICRIAQKARAAGMYLIVATQRPSADVITGLMKANIPSRIAFAVASQMESRIILDQTGAEKLIGKGDMLYAPLGEGKAKRVQGCFISSDEIEAVIAKVKEGATAEYSEEILEHIERRAQNEGGGGGTGDPSEDEDEMLWEAVDVVMDAKQASTSMLQRRLKLGYARAARIVDQMEERGIVGASEGSKPRQILITRDQWQEIKARRRM